MASRVSGFPQTDWYVNNSLDLYPGEAQCKGYSPHALWHEESASGLLEIIYTADYAHRILENTRKRQPELWAAFEQPKEII